MWISSWPCPSTQWKWSPAIWKWTCSRSSCRTSRVASRSITLILWFRGHRTSCKRYCKIQFFLLGEQVRFVVLICFKVILIKAAEETQSVSQARYRYGTNNKTWESQLEAAWHLYLWDSVCVSRSARHEKILDGSSVPLNFQVLNSQCLSTQESSVSN